MPPVPIRASIRYRLSIVCPIIASFLWVAGVVAGGVVEGESLLDVSLGVLIVAWLSSEDAPQCAQNRAPSGI
jgi:hypothetical protein